MLWYLLTGDDSGNGPKLRARFENPICGGQTQYTLTTNATAGGTVSPGSGNYNSGTVVTVTATANPGFTFSGWSGALTGTTNPATITMNAAKSVTANFTAVGPTTYVLTTNATAGGTVSPGSGSYNSGTVVTVTATANPGFTFSGWSGALTGTTNPATITMDAAKNVTANFTAVAPITYVLTTNVNPPGSGFVSPGGSYNSGTVVTLTATANAGFAFSGWSGDLSGSTNPTTITMNAAKNVTANFTAVVGESAPWSESFTYANGTTSHGSPTTWSATNIRVQSNEMAFNNVGADGVFTTGPINISSGPVTVSLNVRGGVGLNAGQDFLRLYAKVDGGAEVQLGAANGPQAAATWTANIATGSSLVLIARAHVTDPTEYYYFDNLSVTSGGGGGGGLPSPWVTADIGAVGAVGSATYSDPTFTIKGSGADILSTADEFRYVSQSSSGDCTIVARVASIQNTNAWAKSGVMIRESTAANSPNLYVFVTPTSGVAITWRATAGGITNNATAAVAGQTAPKWLKITRVANVFTASRSDDGVTWTQVGTAQTISMATTATLGLAVTSHADGTLCTSTVDNVTATP